MSHIEIDEARCKGCLLCTSACPKNLLRPSDRMNHQGYKVVEIPVEERSNCSGCASCAVLCPDMAIRVWKTARAATAGGSEA